jgi:cytochrome c peroxidase
MARLDVRLCLGLVVAALGCDPVMTPPDQPTPPLPLDVQLRQDIAQWGVIPIGPMPAQPAALVDLGRALMFDKILSGNRDISCGTCHHPQTHAADGLSLSVGTGGSGMPPGRTLGAGRQFVPRSAPTLINAGLGLFYMFWDGRLAGGFFGGPGPGPGPVQGPDGIIFPNGLPNLLATQAMLPVLNRQEMRGEPGDLDRFGVANELAQYADSDYVGVWQAVMRRLLAIPEYVTRFNAAFPGVPTTQLGFQHAATAIATFQRQALVRTDSPFDRYLGRDDAALSPAEKRGAVLFFRDGLCVSCHNGPFLGGQSFANTGTPQLGPGVGAGAPLDKGRGEVENQPFYDFAFRAPPLRNVELTAPYMHNGAYATLEAVIEHYNDVELALRTYDASQLAPELRGQVHGDAATIDAVLATLDFRMRQRLNLTAEQKSDLLAFLKALTDAAARDLSGVAPATVPSGLPVAP